MMSILPLFLNKIGLPGLIIILLLVVLLFGANKIPEVMRGMGRGVKEFKDAMNDSSKEEPSKKEDEKTEEKK